MIYTGNSQKKIRNIYIISVTKMNEYIDVFAFTYGSESLTLLYGDFGMNDTYI
jgi:hypothetical protein